MNHHESQMDQLTDGRGLVSPNLILKIEKKRVSLKATGQAIWMLTTSILFVFITSKEMYPILCTFDFLRRVIFMLMNMKSTEKSTPYIKFKII